MQSFNYKVCSRCGVTSKWVNTAGLCPTCQHELANAPQIARARHHRAEDARAVSGDLFTITVPAPLPWIEDNPGQVALAEMTELIRAAQEALSDENERKFREALAALADAATHYSNTVKGW